MTVVVGYLAGKAGRSALHLAVEAAHTLETTLAVVTVVPKPWRTPSLARIDAHRRFHAAIDHVGPGLADICWRVVCAGEGIGGAEKALGWPARSGKLVLGLALDRLARFYGMG